MAGLNQKPIETMFLKESLTVQFATAEIAATEPEFLSLVSSMWRYANDNYCIAAAAVIPAELLPKLADNNHAVVLVVLPAVAEDKVLGMLDGEADVFNVLQKTY